MERGINDNEPRNAQAIYLSVEEKFEALQDEVNLLKIEIKQTLVDLREFMLNGENRFARFAVQQPPSESSPGFGTEQTAPPGNHSQEQERATGPGAQTTINLNAPQRDAPLDNSVESAPSADRGSESIPASGHTAPSASQTPRPQVPESGAGRNEQRASGPQPQTDPQSPPSGFPGVGFPSPSSPGNRDSNGVWDVEMLGNILSWLNSVKDKGLSPQQLAPYLHAYQMMGYISPVMAKLIHRSIASLDQLDEDFNHNAMSSSDFLECLRQLHDIICTPGYGYK